jgi:uncharacterized protein YlxP (DUF503 family)
MSDPPPQTCEMEFLVIQVESLDGLRATVREVLEKCEKKVLLALASPVTPLHRI